MPQMVSLFFFFWEKYINQIPNIMQFDKVLNQLHLQLDKMRPRTWISQLKNGIQSTYTTKEDYHFLTGLDLKSEGTYLKLQYETLTQTIIIYQIKNSLKLPCTSVNVKREQFTPTG